jgi:hypothetical protein
MIIKFLKANNIFLIKFLNIYNHNIQQHDWIFSSFYIVLFQNLYL